MGVHLLLALGIRPWTTNALRDQGNHFLFLHINPQCAVAFHVFPSKKQRLLLLNCVHLGGEVIILFLTLEFFPNVAFEQDGTA